MKASQLNVTIASDLRHGQSHQDRLKLLKLISNSLNAFVGFSDKHLEEVHLANSKLAAVKDNFCAEGFVTTCGSKILSNFASQYSATVVERLRESGATILAKTNLDEFAMGNGTVDSAHGPTKNVYRSGVKYRLLQNNKELQVETGPLQDGDWFIAGGSSGGSAVAVATDAVDFAISSDTGGSTRYPASYCGVVGLKPSYGLVSRRGLIPLVNSLDCPGIMARSVNDVGEVLNAISGPDYQDSTTIQRQPRKVSLDNRPTVDQLVIGIPKEYFSPDLSEHVLNAWRQVADLLSDGGAKVIQISLPHTKYSTSCYSVLNCCEVASNMARYCGLFFGQRASKDCRTSTEELYAKTREAGFNDVVRGRILAGNYFLLKENCQDYFEQALRVRRLISNDFDSVWQQGVDLLLTPVTLTTARKYSDFNRRDNRENCEVEDFFTQPVNLAGLPAINVPIEMADNSLPVGLQLIGKFLDENMLLNAAKFIESEVNFPRLQVIL